MSKTTRTTAPPAYQPVVPGAVEFEVVRATRFELVDQQGRLWGGLGFTDDGDPSFILCDASGSPRVTARVTPDGAAGFCIKDATDTVRVTVGVSPDGEPTVECLNPDGTAQGRLEALGLLVEALDAHIRGNVPPGPAPKRPNGPQLSVIRGGRS